MADDALVIRIRADVGGASHDLGQVEAKVASLAAAAQASGAAAAAGLQQTATAARAAGGALLGVGSQLRSLFAAGGALGIIAGVRSIVSSLDALEESAQAAGTTVAALSALRYAASFSGVGAEQLDRALVKLNEQLVDATRQGSDAQRVFAALGIKVRDAGGNLLSSDAALAQIADRFAGFRESAEKSALATALFGERIGPRLIPLLNEGAGGLERLKAEAERLGVVIGSQTASDAARFNDNLDRLQASARAAAVALISPLLPALSEYIERASRAAIVTRDLFDAMGATARARAGRPLADVSNEIAEVTARLDRVGDSFNRLLERKELESRLRQLQGEFRLLQQDAQRAAQAASDLFVAGSQLRGRAEPGRGRFSGLDLATAPVPDSREALAEIERRRREAAREAAERQREAERLAAAEARAFAELNRERLAYAATLAKSVTTLDEEIRRQRESLEEIGLTGAALSQLRVKRLEARIAAEEAALATVELDAAERRAIELRIARLKELIGLERERAGREAAVDAARVAEQEWTRTSQVIEQSLTDALMRGFESGKDFGRSFRDALVNMFKTLVLRPIIQPIAQAGAGAILGALGLGTPGIAQAATGLNLGSALGRLTLGTGGLALPALAGAYAVYSLIRGNRRSPAQQNYSVLSGTGASLAGGALDLYGSVTPNLASRDAYDEALRAAIAGISASALALGGRPNLDLRYGLYSSVSPDNRGGYTSGELRDAAGRVLYNVGTEGSNETVDQRLQQQISALFLAGLQASNLPQDIADYLGQFSPASTSQEQLNTIVATATAAHSMAGAVRGLGGALEDVAGLSVEARSQLAEFAGGFDNFAQQLRGFVEQYYSRDEIAGLRAREIRDVLAGVGITQDLSTREQFRALVESLDVSGEQGRRQLAALLGVSGSFAGLADYLAESGGTLQSAAGGAPDLGALGSALASSGQQQVQAVIGVQQRLDHVGGLLERILQRIGDTHIVIQAPSALEVGTIGGGN